MAFSDKQTENKSLDLYSTITPSLILSPVCSRRQRLYSGTASDASRHEYLTRLTQCLAGALPKRAVPGGWATEDLQLVARLFKEQQTTS